MRDSVFKKMLSRELQNLNRGLARKRKSFKDLLEEENPFVSTREGEKLFFEKEHLKELEKIVPSYERKELKLPIFFYADPVITDQYYVKGKTEAEVIKKLGGLERYKMIKDKLWIPKSLGYPLQRKYRNVIQIIWLP